MKIFNISFHKNGTTSFHCLMKNANLKSLHNTGYFSRNIMNFKNKEKNEKIVKYSNNNKNLHPIDKINNFINYDKLDKLIDSYDVFSDMPFPYLYKYLDTKYPNSLFIYVYRDSEKWYKSIDNHSDKYTNMRKLIYGYGRAKNHKKKYVSLYNSHQEEITKYFKDKNNLLKVNLTDPKIGEKICNFCNFKKNIPFEKKNTTKTN